MIRAPALFEESRNLKETVSAEHERSFSVELSPNETDQFEESRDEGTNRVAKPPKSTETNRNPLHSLTMLESLQCIRHQSKRLTPLSRPLLTPIPGETARGLPDLDVILHPRACPLQPGLRPLSPLVVPGKQITSETEAFSSVPICSFQTCHLVFPTVRRQTRNVARVFCTGNCNIVSDNPYALTVGGIL